MKYLIIFKIAILLSGNVFADCEKEFFTALKAGNLDKATVALRTTCTKFYVEDEFGSEENIYSEFRKVSEPFLLKYDECQMYSQSYSWKEHLKLKMCLEMRAISFYKKRLNDPIGKTVSEWRDKYNKARSKEVPKL